MYFLVLGYMHKVLELKRGFLFRIYIHILSLFYSVFDGIHFNMQVVSSWRYWYVFHLIYRILKVLP